MPAHYLGREPGIFVSLGDKRRKHIVGKIFENIMQGVPVAVACWCEEVDPEEFEEAQQQDRWLWSQVQTWRARAEKALILTAKEGGPGAHPAKQALQILERTYKGWASKASVDLSKQFEESLAGMREQFELDPDRVFTGAEAYEVVIQALAKHA